MRRLTFNELEQIHLDIIQSSAWAKAELKRQLGAKKRNKSEHGIDDGTANQFKSNLL
ncbi:hypothetical protein [Marinobacterium iners]|uniref:Uncharacterized protein n=1 Tax=Marinobacterium iners DSM 11526 TaxID=1122198 RepID=A0A1H4CTC2_9GAMM|nr:hypothetical protein [Marinobacterium iners]SEA63693.1 hypothetical protein SAMN02745729_105142 [Marinobacterium iners DSM 11526]